MAKKKKKKKKKPQIVRLTPQKYIQTKANKLPFGTCYINEIWEEEGLASIIITRVQPSGKLIVGVYLVDIFCLGLKQTAFRFGMEEEDFLDFKEEIYRPHEQGEIEAYPMLLQNIIYGAIEYADELGFKVKDKDFNLTRYILDPRSELFEMEVEFGKDGKPFYIVGPFDDPEVVIPKLVNLLGEDGFEYYIPDEYYDMRGG